MVIPIFEKLEIRYPKMKKAILILSLFIMTCNSSTNMVSIEKEDLLKINALHENYRTFWLENDSAKVVNLFSEKGALIPPGNSGDFVKGKKAIGEWWFNIVDDTTYPITGFTYSKDTLIVVDSKTAIWEGLSTVSWNTVIKDSVISSAQSSSNFITICLKEESEWKILRQIWNVRPGEENQKEAGKINLSGQTCIEKIIALDDSLGTIRNHACKTISLSETIKQYTAGMNQFDFQTCPEAFTVAFKKHIAAWTDMLVVTNQYPELRGEMHDLFDQLEVGEQAELFKSLLKSIWDTWAEVEQAMK